VCAWRKKEMKLGTGEPEKQGAGKEMVSHGICPRCAKKLWAEAKALRAYRERCAKKLRAEAKALRAYHEKRESGLTGLTGLMTGGTNKEL
jgi:hypothetical protein